MVCTFPIVALFGAAVGSFLNVCIYRWPRDESVLRPRSHCLSCTTPIAMRDTIPVVSWLLLRGRCRTCGSRISVRYPFVELLTAALALIAVWRYGVSGEALCAFVFTAMMLVVVITDFNKMIIPDKAVVVATVAGLVFAVIHLSW